ncbi:MAG: hypothetical protein P1U89_12175 [Verrucomicrobiales bacterium]|nr:hypothetical protein [Verrucomicrobiales bacterium]
MLQDCGVFSGLTVVNDDWFEERFNRFDDPGIAENSPTELFAAGSSRDFLE